LIHCIFNPASAVNGDRCGPLKCYAEAGDFYPCGTAFGVPVICTATAGQLLLNCEACNNVTNPGGNPSQSGSNAPSPVGTWDLGGTRWNTGGRIGNVPSEGPCFVPISLPARGGVGLHGGRGDCTSVTHGCIRGDDDCIGFLGTLIDLNGGGTITVNPPPRPRRPPHQPRRP